MDQAALRTACTMGIHGSPECEKYRRKAMVSLTVAAAAPANGVHKPTIRNMPAPIPMLCRIAAAGDAVWRRFRIPKWISAGPVSSRKSRSLRLANHHQTLKRAVAQVSVSGLDEAGSRPKHLKLGAACPPF
jgi:hypothetical protein